MKQPLLTVKEYFVRVLTFVLDPGVSNVPGYENCLIDIKGRGFIF